MLTALDAGHFPVPHFFVVSDYGTVSSACSPDLGTAVLVAGVGRDPAERDTEGVVIEVVPPRCKVHSKRAVYSAQASSARSLIPRYVVQTWNRRVLVCGFEMDVVAL